MNNGMTFVKTGAEIKAAIGKRVESLQSRLNRRNEGLDALMKDSGRLRSYLVRSSVRTGGHGYGAATLYSEHDISSEEKEEIQQMCRRIFELEQELHRLRLTRSHLQDEQKLQLSFDDLVNYGFEVLSV